MITVRLIIQYVVYICDDSHTYVTETYIQTYVRNADKIEKFANIYTIDSSDNNSTRKRAVWIAVEYR